MAFGHRNRQVHAKRQGAEPAVIAPVIVGGISIGVLWAFKEAIVGRALSLVTGTKCRVKKVHVNPWKGLLGFKDLRVWDPQGRPALSTSSLMAKVGRGLGTHKKRRFFSVTAVRPEVELVFDNYLLTQSNWSMIVEKARGVDHDKPALSPAGATVKLQPGDAEKERQHRRVVQKKKSTRESKSSKGMAFTFKVEGGVLLSVRSAALKGKRLIDDVHMRGVDLDWDDVSSAERLAASVENLAAHALSTRGNLHGPRDVKRFARSYARAILKEETKDVRLKSKLTIKKLRERIGFFDRWLLRDIPQLEQYSEIAGKGNVALKFVEDLLHSWDSDSEESSHEKTQTREKGTRKKKNQNAEKSVDKLPTAPLYRELSEEWDK